MEEEEEEDDWAAAAGVLERGRASVDGAGAPTEADAYETQMALVTGICLHAPIRPQLFGKVMNLRIPRL